MSPNFEETKKPAAESAAVEATAPGGKEELNKKLEEKAAQLRAVYGEAEELGKSVEATEVAVKNIPHLSAALEIIKSQFKAKQEELSQVQGELAAVQAEFDALPETEEAVPEAEAVTEQKIIDVEEPARQEISTATVDEGWEEPAPVLAEAAPIKTETIVEIPTVAETETVQAPSETTSIPTEQSTTAEEERMSQFKKQMQEQIREDIAKRSRAAHLFATRINDLRIPDEWKSRIHEKMTKELEGNEKGGGNIKDYTWEPIQKLNELTHAPEIMKVLDPEIEKESADLEQHLRDIKKLEWFHDKAGKNTFRGRPGVGIPYENLPDDLRAKLSSELNDLKAKHDRGEKGFKYWDEYQEAFNNLFDKHVQDIDRTLISKKSHELPIMREKLMAKLEALEKHPRFLAARTDVYAEHKQALQKI